MNKLNALIRGTMLTCLCLGWIKAPAVAAQAGTGGIRVAPSGSDVSGCGSESLPCQTIQYAVDSASSGDMILVACSTDGTRYTSQSAPSTHIATPGKTAVVYIHNKQLTILGGYAVDDWSTSDPGTNLTFIDGQNTNRGVFVISTGQTSLRMEGFTIQKGLARGMPERGGDDRIFSFGGGMFVDSAQELVLRNMIFKNNKSIGEDTDSAYGGSGSGGGLALRLVPQATLEHLTFEGNQTKGGSGVERGGYSLGGGFYTDRSIVSGKYFTFTANISEAGSSSGSGRTADGQRADGFGGAASLQGSHVTLQHVTATNNQAYGGNANMYAGGAFGGAIKVEDGALTLMDAELRQNLARGGNAQNGYLGNGGGLEAINASITIERASIINNEARGGNGTTGIKGPAGGGGINSTWTRGDKAVLSVSNSIVADNMAAEGGGAITSGGGAGGIWIQATDANIVHTTVARNHLGDSAMHGQGILLAEVGDTPAVANISYSIVAGHTGVSGAAALHVKPNNAVTLHRSLWSNNDRDTNADASPGGWYAPGIFNGLDTMLSGAASFVSPGAPDYDYHIQGDSDAKDQAAGSTTELDIDNEIRNNGPPDIGADEYVPIVLTVQPVTSASLYLSWRVNTSLVPGLDHYNLVFSHEPGASPPDQGNSPINVCTQTSYTLTGLSNYRKYTMTIAAHASSGALIATSNTVTAFPTDIFVYLPVAIK
jgi:hypothetical protein